MSERLADLLLRLRQESGLTQEGLADKAGLSIHNVRNYERGSRVPNLGAAHKLAKALGVPLESLAERVAPDEPTTKKRLTQPAKPGKPADGKAKRTTRKKEK